MNAERALPWLAGLIGSALLLPGAAAAAELNVTAVGREVGQEVGRRWCSGEPPTAAIEAAVGSYLQRHPGAEAQLNDEARADALGKEITIEALTYSFQQCPKAAGQALRNIMNTNP